MASTVRAARRGQAVDAIAATNPSLAAEMDALLDLTPIDVEWPANPFCPAGQAWIAAQAVDLAAIDCPFWVEAHEHARLRPLAADYLVNPGQRTFLALVCAIDDCLPDNIA